MSKDNENFEDIFDQIDFDKAQKEINEMSPEDKEEIFKHFLLNFPIEDYANTINKIFKIFKGTKDHHAFVQAMKQHVKNQGK